MGENPAALLRNVEGRYTLRMTSRAHSVWKWQEFKPGKKKGRVLRWHMDEAQAAAYAEREGVRLEQVPGSEEIRIPQEIGPGLMRNVGTRK